MKRRVSLLLIALVLITVLGFVLFHSRHTSEPKFNGKPLTSWLDEYEMGHTPESSNAVREIGTNAIPMLLEFAGAQDGMVKSLVMRTFDRPGQLAFDFRSAENAHNLAAAGFYILGSAAEAAIPDLTNLTSKSNYQVQLTAIECLGSIGPAASNAVPLLVEGLHSDDDTTELECVYALGEIHDRPEMVIQALIADLAVHPRRAYFIARTLGEFGTNASSAVPYLLPFLTNRSLSVRSSASNALLQIDPEAASRAGVVPPAKPK